MRYVLAFYEMDRAYGGPEEGGWWYDTGQLERPFRIVTGEARAITLVARANALLERLQRTKRSVSSVAYQGGRHRVVLFENAAPHDFPKNAPRYE